MKKFNTTEKIINTASIMSDAAYQRPLNAARASRIAKNWNPNLCNMPKVSYRDGKYWVFDGQHTIAAIRKLVGGDTNVRCKVYEGMTQEDEAALFAAQNGDAAAVLTRDKLKALYAAGDPEVTAFHDAVERCGVFCRFSQTGGDMTIRCYGTAFRIYRTYGEAHLCRVLDLLTAAWDGRGDSLSNSFVAAASLIIQKYAELDDKAFADKLSKSSVGEIVRNSKDYARGSAAARTARAMVAAYNKGKRAGRFDEERLLK